MDLELFLGNTHRSKERKDNTHSKYKRAKELQEKIIVQTKDDKTYPSKFYRSESDQIRI